jgi:flagellar biosynthetic protein FliP
VSPANRAFARHYLEMVAAMLLGMIALGLPAAAALTAAGSSWSELREDAPALALLLMAFSMTVPMVGWMRHRGHAWRPCADMSAAMLGPTLAVIALLAAGLVTDVGILMTVEHVVMLPSMLAVMLLRRDEYSGHHHHPREVTA